MATAKKTAVKKGTKTYAFITVDKNNYTEKVSALANGGATVYAVNTSDAVQNSYDVHYFTVAYDEGTSKAVIACATNSLLSGYRRENWHSDTVSMRTTKKVRDNAA